MPSKPGRFALAAAVTALSSPLAAQIDAAEGAGAFAEFGQLCAADGGELWGVSLCGPLLLVEPRSRTAAANLPDPGGAFVASDGLYVGVLPEGLGIANTAIDWGGRRWTELLWPLPDDAVERRVLMAHEAFHRIQLELGFAPREGDNGHLDTLDGRLWLRLEAAALDRALAEANWQAAAHDALRFRAERLARFPAAEAGETALISNEGVAEYTGIRLGAGVEADRIARERLGSAGERPSLVRALGYVVGPAYGLLLDRSGVEWRSRAIAGAPLPHLLAEAISWPGAATPLRSERYGYAAIRAEEAARVEALAARRAELRAALVDGPTLELPAAQMQIEFNPNHVFALDGEGTVYSGMTIRADWGTLTAEGDVLLPPDWSFARVAGPVAAEGARLDGPGWRIELAPHWALAGDAERARLERR